MRSISSCQPRECFKHLGRFTLRLLGKVETGREMPAAPSMMTTRTSSGMAPKKSRMASSKVSLTAFLFSGRLIVQPRDLAFLP